MYGAQVVTDTSTPYKWATSGNYKCIQEAGVNIGYRCKTDAVGLVITATGSVLDLTNCPRPSTAREECYYGGQKLSEYSPAYKVVSDCIVTDTNVWTGHYCNPTTFMSGYDLTRCPVPVRACVAGATCAGGEAVGTCAVGVVGRKCTCPTGASYPRYTNDATCTAPVGACVAGATCAGGEAVGTCAVGVVGRKCTCPTGASYPRYTNDATCTAPVAVARTECWYGEKALSSWKTKATTTRYTVEAATGCILDNETTVNGGKGGYNNGWWCNTTNFTIKQDLTKCPL